MKYITGGISTSLFLVFLVMDETLDNFARNNMVFVRSLRGYECEESDDPCGRRVMTVQELDEELDEYHAAYPKLPGRKTPTSIWDRMTLSIRLLWARWKFGL